MIDTSGWFSWAERMPGPPEKVWPTLNALQGVVFHSAVGSRQGVIDVVMGPEEKSVTGVVGYDGRLTQFYSVWASPWANGNHNVNRLFLGFEHEGGAPGNEHEALTTLQVATDELILTDIAAFKGKTNGYWFRPRSEVDLTATLYEHRELPRFPGINAFDHRVNPTACPSGRIPWDVILRGVQGVPDPAPAPQPAPPSLADQSRGLVAAANQLLHGWPLSELDPADLAALLAVLSGLRASDS